MRCFACIFSLHVDPNDKYGDSHLLSKKWRHREVKSLVQGGATKKWWKWFQGPSFTSAIMTSRIRNTFSFFGGGGRDTCDCVSFFLHYQICFLSRWGLYCGSFISIDLLLILKLTWPQTPWKGGGFSGSFWLSRNPRTSGSVAFLELDPFSWRPVACYLILWPGKEWDNIWKGRPPQTWPANVSRVHILSTLGWEGPPTTSEEQFLGFHTSFLSQLVVMGLEWVFSFLCLESSWPSTAHRIPDDTGDLG